MSESLICPICEGHEANPERVLRGFELLQCTGCRMVYVWPRPNRQASRQSYASGHRGNRTEQAESSDPEILMRQYDQEHGPYVQHALAKRLVSLSGGRPVRNMLDFGCGSGHLLGLARETLGCETYGVEVNPVAQEGARRFRFQLHDGPLEDMAPPPPGFDLIYAGQVFEHLPEPKVELGILCNALAPGGVMFLEVPNYNSLSICLGRDSFRNNTPPGHLNYFTVSTLARMMNDIGLRVIKRCTTGLNHRELLGRAQEVVMPSAERGLLRESAASHQGGHRIALGARLKLRVLGTIDLALSVPGWGMQAAVTARALEEEGKL